MLRPITLLALTAFPPTANALFIRSYNATDHKRFDPWPAAAENNTNRIQSNVDLTGIGYRFGTYPARQCALISRQHIVFANHYYPAGLNNGNTVRFLNASNEFVDRTAGAEIVIPDGVNDSDLVIIALDSPIDADSGISPLPYLDLPNPVDYVGQNLIVTGKYNVGPPAPDGQFPLIGTGTIAEVASMSEEVDFGGSTGMLTTRYFRFDYLTAGLGPNDCHFEFGDSGSPSIVPIGSTAALVGVHSGTDDPIPVVIENYDVFIPFYIAQLDAEMAAMGYRMRSSDPDPTTLSTTTTIVQPTPRKALPLDFDYDLENTGANVTGNVEVEFGFQPGEAPDTITPPGGWVTYGSGTKWTFRKATFDPAATATFSATWAAAPSVETLTVDLVRRSDTTADFTQSVDIDLAPSFADWASGLAEPGETDDPDDDMLVNLLEYALGGDPEDGRLIFEDGGPLQPVIEESGGTVSISFPERDDAVLRGLSYTLEFSESLASWSETPPAGIMTSTAAYAPAVDGFVKRTYSWPADPLKRFVRLSVELNE
ncbi:hypothetical protein HAHE_15920 [Haloferula helveola]|uniref:Uncharacterized protein n=1 Tax=Haloferula helveola TaxID=490095 RepID=A0ABN6H548_9BACT|nr:hypothetical protein HAHE_15920 [Haloferula helveola]